MNKNNNAYEQLKKGIQNYVDHRLNNIKKDVTLIGRIEQINSDNTYEVMINNVKYSKIPTMGGTCTINDVVYVLVPQSNYNNMVIIKF